MPIPGQTNNERLLHQSGQRWKLGGCLNDPPPPHGIIGSDNSIRLSISGFGADLASSLADRHGILPELLGNPNSSLLLSPISTNPQRPGDVFIWRGTAGSVNSKGCGAGEIHTIEARAAVDGLFRAIAIKAYVLIKDQAGLCGYALYFHAGSRRFADLATPAGRIDLDNALGRSGFPARLFPEGGAGVIEAVS